MKAIEIAIQELSKYGLSESQLTYELSKKGIEANKEIENVGSFTSSQDFELMKAEILLNIVLSGAKSWTQGDRSKTRDFDGLKAYARTIYTKYGLVDPFADLDKRVIIRRL